MSRDVSLLEAALAGGPAVLRLYGWAPPCLSLGRFQQERGLNLEEARRRGWDVVRRPTGGRAVLHDQELTYAVIIPPEVVGDAGVRTTYAVLSERLHAGLAQVLPGAHPLRPGQASCRALPGVPNCFAVPTCCDTLAGGGKLVGSAQVRRGGALLQHGSILLRADRDAWRAVMGDPGRLVTLEELCGELPPLETLSAVLESCFRSSEPGE